MARYKPYKTELPRIINELESQYKNYIERVVYPRIREELDRLYDLTYNGWSGGGDSGRSPVYIEPTTMIKLESVDIKGKSAVLKIRSMATTDGEAPHKLWYWLDFGTKPYTHVTSSAAFPRRVRQRFIDGSGLDRGPAASNAFQRGSDGRIKYQRIKAGQTRRGIQAQELSLLIAEAASQQRYGDKGFEWDVLDSAANNPLGSL